MKFSATVLNGAIRGVI